MFNRNIQAVPISEVECMLEYDKLHKVTKEQVHQIKNTLLLTNGINPIPPWLLDVGRQMTTTRRTQTKYQVLEGNLSVLAAKILHEELEQHNVLYCFILTRQEHKIFQNLKYLQIKDF
jgi:hypothetical protein